MTPRQCLVEIKTQIPSEWTITTKKYGTEWLAETDIEKFYVVVSRFGPCYSYGCGTVDTLGEDHNDSPDFGSLDSCLGSLKVKLGDLLKKEEW